MLFEYQLPLTSKRADVVLAGRHPRTGGASYVVVELKQWSSARAVRGQRHPRPHRAVRRAPGAPTPRCRSAATATTCSASPTVLAEEPDALAGAAYLHNATDAGVADLFRLPGRRARPALHRAAPRRVPWSSCKTRFSAGHSGAPYADALLGSRDRALQAAARRSRRTRCSGGSSSCCWTSSATPTTSCCTRSSGRGGRTPRGRDRHPAGPGSGKSVIALSPAGRAVAAGPDGRCTRPAPGPSPRPCARSPGHERRGSRRCSSTSTSSWPPSRTTSTC